MAKKIVKVMPNTDVTWSLSKDGFITQSGTLPDVLSAETVESFLEAGQGKFACSEQMSWYLLNGDLYGCGNNSRGQQGSGDTTNVLTYTKRASNVKDVVCSGGTTWYIDNNGDLYGCGYNGYGQQGDGTTTDVLTFTKRISNVKNVVCSGGTTWYIDQNNDLYGCGSNSVGQQGSGNTTDVTTFTKRASNVKDVICGNYITWYITNSGDLYGCGYNGYGQQGDGTTTDVLTFTKRASNVKDFAVLDKVSWYIDNNGGLYGCGNNGSGLQGSGDTTEVATFTKRASNVKSVNSQDTRTFYITNNGDLYGTGYGGNYVLGNNSTEDVKTFTKIASNVNYVTGSNQATFYITNNGDLYGAGWNASGTLGEGAADGFKVFKQIASNVKNVYIHNQTSWYIDNDGVLYSTGSNFYGQQSSDDTTNVLTFTQRVSGLNGLTANLTINPTPSDATVIIDGEETTSKDVPQGKLIEYSVGKSLFKTEKGSTRLYEDETIDVTLSKEVWTQKENFKDNDVTYATNGTYAGCNDTSFDKMWKNGYNNVTSLPQTLSPTDYPCIYSTSMTSSPNYITITLPDEYTMSSFKLVLFTTKTTSNATCQVIVENGNGSWVYKETSSVHGVGGPLIFSKTGSFKVKKIRIYDGSSDANAWKSQIALYSLILK